MFLVTGCGRSGTKYMASVLCAAGLDVGHECAGSDGTVSSHWAVDDTEYPPYHQQGARPQFDVILHQVREPLATIGSLTTTLTVSWLWNRRHVPIRLLWPSLRKAAEYWLYWNRLAEGRAALTYRVEDIKNAWPTICGHIGLIAPFPAGVPTNVNSRRHREVTWKDIYTITPKAAEIRRMAQRYGYGKGT